MGATLLDGVVMEPGSIVAAGAVVAPGASGAGGPGVALVLQPRFRLTLSAHVLLMH
jgi:acetyltransferase-like isoleucine patch superfamily enzyme